jgi:hypothetical protein
MNPVMKVPLYVVLGVSVNFTLIFSMLDMVNFTMGLCQKAWQRTMVETPS